MLILAHFYYSNAQVGINTNSPHSSTALHIESVKKGLLIPMVNQEMRNNLAESAAKGLIVCDTTGQVPIFYAFDGTNWITLNPLQATDETEDIIKLSNGASEVTLNNNLSVLGNFSR
jgi:hypothetical protein